MAEIARAKPRDGCEHTAQFCVHHQLLHPTEQGASNPEAEFWQVRLSSGVTQTLVRELRISAIDLNWAATFI